MYLGKNITDAKKTGSGLVGFIWWPGDAALLRDWFEREAFEPADYIFRGRPSTAPWHRPRKEPRRPMRAWLGV